MFGMGIYRFKMSSRLCAFVSPCEGNTGDETSSRFEAFEVSTVCGVIVCGGVGCLWPAGVGDTTVVGVCEVADVNEDAG